jgi:hypothetical protein
VAWVLPCALALGALAGTEGQTSNLRRLADAPVDQQAAVRASYDDGNGRYRYRGVNLGGWLVLESWMYPDWWKTTGVPVWLGEWQFCETLGKDRARELLETHWDTWVTRKELEDLKSAGITHLRVPIGYWILGEPYLKPDEPYVPGGFKYLLRLLKWCKELGLLAIIDLHGAPGAQNGNDNSGYSGGNAAIKWNQPENLQRTNDVLVYLAKNLTAVNNTEDYKGSVLGLCLLNEPWTTTVGGPITLEEVASWAQTAVDAVLAAGWKGHIWFPDGFNPTSPVWQGKFKPPQYQNVYADAHIYMLFDPALKEMNAAEQAARKCSYDRPNLEQVDIACGTVVGEWSMDYPKYPAYPPSPQDLADLQKAFVAQAQAFNILGSNPATKANGGFFWSFKSLGRTGDDVHALKDNLHSPWSYLAMWRDGIALPDLSTNNVSAFDCTANRAAPGRQRFFSWGGV